MNFSVIGKAFFVVAFGYWFYTLFTFECVTPGYVVLILMSLMLQYERCMKLGIRFYTSKIMPQDERIDWNLSAICFTSGQYGQELSGLVIPCLYAIVLMLGFILSDGKYGCYGCQELNKVVGQAVAMCQYRICQKTRYLHLA